MSLETPGQAFAGPLTTEQHGARIAWSADLTGSVPVAREVVDSLRPALQAFMDLDCHLEEAAPDLAGADSVFNTLRAWQLEYTLGPLLERNPGQFKSDAVWNIEQGRRLTGNDIGKAEIAQTTLHHTMRLFFQQYDFLITPVSQVAPFDAELPYPQEINGHVMDNYLEWMRLPSIISVTGCPAISVPAAFTPAGLPIGLQIIAPPRAEKALLQIAYAFEQRNGAGARRPDARSLEMTTTL